MLLASLFFSTGSIYDISSDNISTMYSTEVIILGNPVTDLYSKFIADYLLNSCQKSEITLWDEVWNL